MIMHGNEQGTQSRRTVSPAVSIQKYIQMIRLIKVKIHVIKMGLVSGPNLLEAKSRFRKVRSESEYL